jgi:steroid 5-alpha reductase family enzyme
MFSWVMAAAAATGTNTTHVLDSYDLAITALVTLGYQLLFFTEAFALQTDKLTDVAGGTNFAILAVLTLSLRHAATARPIVASLLLIVWALRLAGFSVIPHPEDRPRRPLR